MRNCTQIILWEHYAQLYSNYGNATFLCAVEVKRGVPSPWEQISWSTKNATQGVVGDGNGNVINQGWM